jgi:diaminopropionate ammonia-lyase
MIPQVLPIRFYLNPAARREEPYGPSERAILNAAAHEEAFREISSWRGYEPTPLLSLPNLAAALGLKTLWIKDEGKRLGLRSFKALGGIYGVYRTLLGALAEEGINPVPSLELMAGTHGELTQPFTITCASVGNHGQAVARGAALFGCRARIFLPSNTATFRREAIQSLGAEIVEVDGSYDEAVVASAERAEAEGWLVVSDTAYPGYEEIPRHIMQGYTVMAREALAQLPGEELPTHVFLQAGVGGLAAAVTAHLWETLGEDRPTVTVVEPSEADCLLESALHGSETPSRGSLDTSMAGLACREPSLLAWKILSRGADAFLTIPDHGAQETVSLLAKGVESDPQIQSQPSGVAGLTGAIAATFEPALSGPLGLGEDSRVIIFGSEGPP